MRTLRARLGDPRLHVLAALIGLVLAVGALSRPDPTPCPECPGHNESAADCLCYHAPAQRR